MLKQILFCLLSATLFSSLRAEEKHDHSTNNPLTEPHPILKDKKSKISYAIGLDIGGGMRKEGVEIDTQMVLKGLNDGYSGTNVLYTEKQVYDIKEAFDKEVEVLKKQAQAVQIEKLRKEGEAFLAENKKKDGVVTLPSGLQYKVIKEGTGEKPVATNTVLLHYKGRFVDGTEFDNSYKREIPNTVPLNVVIKGWAEALQLMKVGSKWEVFIPSNLAYGARGADHSRGRQVQPHATLIYEMELVGIKK